MAFGEKELKVALELGALLPALSDANKAYLLGFLEGYTASNLNILKAKISDRKEVKS